MQEFRKGKWNTTSFLGSVRPIFGETFLPWMREKAGFFCGKSSEKAASRRNHSAPHYYGPPHSTHLAGLQLSKKISIELAG